MSTPPKVRFALGLIYGALIALVSVHLASGGSVSQEQAIVACPDPGYILLVRCPGPHEITGMTMSCKQKVFIDECAKVAQGEGK